MSLWTWIKSWFAPAPSVPGSLASADTSNRGGRGPRRRHGRRIRLALLKRRERRQPRSASRVTQKPYAFAQRSVFGGYLDLSRDGDDGRLTGSGLPVFHTPKELADWLQVPLGQLAWLIHRFAERQRAEDFPQAHYHFLWIPKRSGGERLIEVPKPKLKAIQERILLGILNRVRPHSAAHGFVPRRSIRSNAAPHVGQRVLLQLDLQNFYPSVSYSRVVAIFRSLGYCREAAVWLGRLTTSDLPDSIKRTLYDRGPSGKWQPYNRRHLPQGTSTSPALANLSAFPLDLRLAGLARTFNARYTRYADDITFSGDEAFRRQLAVFIPLVTQIIRSERFRLNRAKRRIVRNSQRQVVTGVVVNEKQNVSRKDFDLLKATLVNCVRRGPSTQNHRKHPDFAAHLQGRIAHVTQLNPQRGQRLQALYQRIDWNR